MAVSEWTTQQVGKWLKDNNFREYINLFCKEHKIDGLALLSLTEQDLKDPPLEITVLGDIKRLGLAIRKLQLENVKDTSIVGLNLSNLSSNSFMLEGKTLSVNGSFVSATSNLNNSSSPYRRQHSRLDSVSTEYSTVSDDDDQTSLTSYESRDFKNDMIRNPLPPEYVKLCLSCIYMVCVFLTTAFVMVVVNDRVPDMNKWPPLPDLILDNVPYIPWAFQLCEITAMSMMTVLIITLFLHKHRFIIIRRLCVLSGTIFLLRCITMFITSLSVPGRHLQCVPYPNATLSSKVERAFVIWRGAGMAIQGVRTCGDYMFSGHTVVVTLLNFFITEYTPSRLPMLHTATWIGNIFGIFFILAAHEHYSIDVFVAFYITSRLFLYYHSLANNRVLRQADRRRTRIWFPMFSFFESRVNGIVPNEFEWPLPTHQIVNDCFATIFDIRQSKKKKRL